MARFSKHSETGSQQFNKKIWKAALYARLSREDGDKEESDSISTQRSLLLDFVNTEKDIQVYNTYIDDGRTGTNFERPGFQAMITDIRAGNVNCVIVKDLSRFGREYIGVGQYLEKEFPLLNIRFISINDMVDSVKNPQSSNSIVVPFKNLINDEYCRESSNKVRSALNTRRKQGMFIGSFASYGYLKDPNDRHKLIIDEEAADVVRNIYDWYIAGESVIGIARKLNYMGIPNPTAYKKLKGFNYQHPTSQINDMLWPDSSVRRILKNRMYTGTLVQGKNRIKSYKVKVAVTVPEDEWIVVENTHEAIIPLDIFEKVQALFQRDTRTAPNRKSVYLFSGFVKCADCGRAMNRKSISQPYAEYNYYVCSTFKKMNKGACTKHTMRSDVLETVVYETLRKQIEIAVSMDDLIGQINKRSNVNVKSKRLEASLAEQERLKIKAEKCKDALYPDWKDGAITKEEYHTYKSQFENQIRAAENAIQTIRLAIHEANDGVDNNNPFISGFIKYKNITMLTRELVVELIDNIYIHEGGEITIQFKFADEYQRALEYIRENEGLIETA